MENLPQTLLIIFMLGCVLPLITLGIMAFVIFRFGQRQLERFVAPNTEALFEKYQKMYSDNPNVDTRVYVQRIVNQQAFKSGVVGAITGLGGFITLPIALPIDVLLSVQIQAAMIEFIAQAYGHPEDRDSRVATYMIMSGSGEVTQMTSRVVMRYAVQRLTGKFLSKFIPLFGAVVGFLVNYSLARSTGWVAMQWYDRKNTQTVDLPAGQAV
jgi:uncharacterized protein (DUF697 family)